MNDRKRNSKCILILLAGLVLLLHATIPHHHHLDSSCNDYRNSSTTDTRGECPTEADKHCHALNNIIDTKPSSITIDTNTAFNALLFVITASNIIKLYQKVLRTAFPIKDFVILKHYLPAKLSLRGPPVLA